MRKGCARKLPKQSCEVILRETRICRSLIQCQILRTVFVDEPADSHKLFDVLPLPGIVIDQTVDHLSLGPSDQDKNAGQHGIDGGFEKGGSTAVFLHDTCNKVCDLWVDVRKLFRSNQESRVEKRQN